MGSKKVIVLSDVHFGGPWLTAEAEKRVVRLLDAAAAVDSGVDQVVFAGDSLELELHPITPHPPPMTRGLLQRGLADGSPLLHSIKNLAKSKRVIFIAGNHDSTLDGQAIHELLGVEYWPPGEPFFVLRSDDGCATVAIAHGHLDDPLCKPVLMPKCGFAESVAYFLGRLGASHEEADEAVSAHTPVPLSTMVAQLVAKLRNAIPAEVVVATAAKPHGVVQMMLLCLTAYARYAMGRDVTAEMTINCGDSRRCTWSDVVQLFATQFAELLGLDSIVGATTADAVWEELLKYAHVFDPNLCPHALRIARLTGARAVVLGHSHVPMIQMLVDDQDKRQVAYANDGASCSGTTHVEIDLVRRELTLVDSADNSRKMLSW